MAMAQSTPIGRIDPSSLIGQADPDIVSPRAVAVLSDAFRSGMINANDIHDRVSERAKSKEKMEITLANRATAEATDPALQEARRQQMLAAGAEAGLSGARATAATSQVPDEALARQRALEQAQGEALYPASKHFDSLAALGGVKALPLTSTGAVDYAKKAEIGAELQLWKTRQDIAKAKLENIVGKEADLPTGTGMFSFTKQGDPSSSAERDALRKTVEAPFSMSGTAPGAVVEPIAPAQAPPPTPAPAPAPAPVTTPVATVQPAVTPPATVVVEPKSPSALSAAVDRTFAPVTGTPLPGGGYQLGTRPPKSAEGGGTEVKMTGEQAAQLSKGLFTREYVGLVRTAADNLAKGANFTSGSTAAGAWGDFIRASDRNPVLADFKAKSAAILAPLIKGIYQETGVLSEEDIKRYKNNIPNSWMTPDVMQVTLDNLEQDIHGSIIGNIESMSLQKQNLDPRLAVIKQNSERVLKEITDEKAKHLAQFTGGTPAATASAVIPTPTGRSFQQDATGNWVLAK